MVAEMVDLTKQYADEELVQPAKALGRVAGVGLGAGVLMSIGALMLSVAAFRALAEYVLPDNPYWSAVGYLVTALMLVGLAAAMVNAASPDEEDPVGMATETTATTEEV